MRAALRAWLLFAASLAGAGCRPAPAPEVPQALEPAERFTCCNLHYEGDAINDANYWLGKTLPAGSRVHVDKVTKDSVTFSAGDVRLTLRHEYGTKEESLRQYLDKVLVAADPAARISAYPASVRRAIEKAKVERGMTREQVLISLGYPPTHRTPAITEREWTYWYSRFLTYKVVFDDSGKVADVIGRPAPTAEAQIKNADAPPASGKSKKHKKK